MPHTLHSVFHPQSIAVIGASDRYGSTGRSVFGQLSANGAAPTVVPVNPKHKMIGGIKSFESLSAAYKEHHTDTAVVILAADKLNAIVREAAKCGIRNVVFINELDPPSSNIRSKLNRASETAFKEGIRLFAVPVNGLRGLYCPLPSIPACAYIGQSAGIADCMQHYATDRGILFSRFITLNPQNYPVSTGKIIDYTASESSTSALLVHISTLDHAQELVAALTAAARHKAVVVLTTLVDADQEALFAHALARRNILTVQTLTEFLTAAKLIHTGIGSHGNRIALISNTPQIGALSLKILPHTGLILAEPSTTTTRAISKLLPHKPSGTNPLNLPADTPPNVFAAAVEHILQDDNTDAVLLIYAGRHSADSYRVAQMTATLQNHSRKPLLLSWLGGADNEAVRQLFNSGKNLHFRQPEHALHALAQLNRYRDHRRSHTRMPPFYDYTPAIQAAQTLHKHLSSFLSVAVLPLPAPKTHVSKLLEGLKLHNQTSTKKSPASQLTLQWEKRHGFGQVLSLIGHSTQRIEILPPVTHDTAAAALSQLGLPPMIWHDWLLDTAEILSRLPEIHALTLTLYHNVQYGITCTEAKFNLQDPDSFTVSDTPQPNLFAPYPTHTEETIILNNGTQAQLRPIRPEDAELINRLATEQSDQSRYLRFMSPFTTLPPSLLAHLSRPDYQREFALILHDEHQIPLATANYTADPCDTSCEFAISTADHLHGQGIGTLLMHRLIRQAIHQGYHTMRAEILTDNHPMQKLALKLGFTLSQHPDDHNIIHAELNLTSLAQ